MDIGETPPKDRENPVWTNKDGVPFQEWVCPKCGLWRNNRDTHKHHS